MGIGGAVAAVSSTLEGCTQSSLSPSAVDFTIDLTESAYAPLNTIGGYIYKSGVIVARAEGGGFLAYTQYCTHAQCIINFNGVSEFICYCHNGVFNSSGKPTSGPPKTALTKYNTSLSGNSLRVYS